MTSKKPKLTLLEVFQLENPNPVDPAQQGEDVKRQALVKAFRDIAPYVDEGDPTLAALNDLLGGAEWEGTGLPQADQVRFGEGLFGLGKSDASKKGGDAKRQAISTAVKDLKPNVPEGDPTIAALNDMLSSSDWEGGPKGTKSTVDWGEFKESCNECMMMDDEEGGCSCGDKHDVAPPAPEEEDGDRDILLDLDLEEPPPIDVPEEEEMGGCSLPPSSNMAPMAPLVSPEVIAVKVSDNDGTDDFMDPTTSAGPIEIPMPLNSREGAPGGPNLSQPTSDVGILDLVDTELNEDVWDTSNKGRDPLATFGSQLDREEPTIKHPHTARSREEEEFLDDPYYAELKNPDPELLGDPDYRKYLKDLEREYAQERASGATEFGGVVDPDELGF